MPIAAAAPAQTAAPRPPAIKIKSVPAPPKFAAKKNPIQLSRNGVLIASMALFLGAFLLFSQSVMKQAPAGPVSGTQMKAAPAKQFLPILPDLSGTTAKKFVLNGITSSGNKMLALINNQVVSVGDLLVEDAVVEDIQRRKAVILHNGQRIVLEL